MRDLERNLRCFAFQGADEPLPLTLFLVRFIIDIAESPDPIS
jgi:hypothetical protein